MYEVKLTNEQIRLIEKILTSGGKVEIASKRDTVLIFKVSSKLEYPKLTV